MIDSVECCRQIQKDQGSKIATINFMKNEFNQFAILTVAPLLTVVLVRIIL